MGCGGKVEEDGRFFVGACGVFFHGGHYVGLFALLGRNGMVDGLETPC